MPEPNEPTVGDPLDAVIAQYIQQVEAGEIPDREALVAQHPELSDRLRDFFADYDRLDRQAAELRLSADPNRTTDSSGPAGELPRVRYFGDYELLKAIAHGGMGIVYKARQVSLNRVVALKMILRGELATERDVIRFRAEAEAAANLDHRHIVPIYEVGEHDGLQYYSMRYVEGASLDHKPRSDARSEAQLVAALAGAVHHAHRRGVLHRDIKPSNILVDRAGVPLVADFGLAKRVDADHSLTESGAIVGTPRYMAPEQAAGRKDLTVAVDVYSLGVVLYERLTGRTPFTGETVLELLRQAREEEPPRPSSVCPGLDRDLETVCLKCLEKDPAKRYTSAEALQDDLERWLRGEPIAARPVGQAERLWRWCRRNPVVAGLSAGLVAALLAGTVISLTFGLRERHERIRAEQAEGIAIAAQDDLEQALARSLVRPLNPEGDAKVVSEPETEALWELAEKPGERLWLRFVMEATRTPLTIKQLRHRAESAWIAAIGLDPEKRKLVEEHLAERLEATDLNKEQKLDLAKAAMILGDLSRATSHQILKILIEALQTPVEVDDFADRLVQFTQQLEPGEAVGILTLALETDSPPDVSNMLAQGLVAAAEGMEAQKAARVLTLALERERNADTRTILAKGLAAVAGRMEPSAAAQVLEKAANVFYLYLEETVRHNASAAGLAIVAERLEAQKAARVLGKAASILTLGLEKQTNAQSLNAVAGQLEGMIGRMEPHEASRALRRAAGILTLALERETSEATRQTTFERLVSLAARMEPREAEQALGQIASHLVQSMKKGTNSYYLPGLAIILSRAAGRMEAREAARASREAANALILSLDNTPNVHDRKALARALAALSGRMESWEAAQTLGRTARILIQSLEREQNVALVQGLAEVAMRMEFREAARVLEKAASILVLALGKTTDAYSRNQLAQALAIVTRGLSKAEAATVCRPVVEMLLHAAETEEDEIERQLTENAVVMLLSASDIPDSSRVSTKVALEVCSSPKANIPLSNHGFDAEFRDRDLDRLLTDDSRAEMNRRTTAMATVMGLVNATPLLALPVFPAASEPLPCLLSTQDLVELLKMPTCFGGARKFVLKHLGNRYGRTFANHWQFVRFAQQQHLDLDFTSPPKRPRRP